jgi:hypothetical protein
MGSQARRLVQEGLQDVKLGRVDNALKTLVAGANTMILTSLGRSEHR